MPHCRSRMLLPSDASTSDRSRIGGARTPVNGWFHFVGALLAVAGLVAERDRPRREAPPAEVPSGVEPHRMPQHDLLVPVPHAHGEEALAALLHEAEAQAVGLRRPAGDRAAVAVVALVVTGAGAQRREVALESPLEPYDVLHVSAPE
jgi:hypothetical protein